MLGKAANPVRKDQMSETVSQSLAVLDLGCGNKKRPGAVGSDFNSRSAADVIHDLNVFPHTLDHSSFDEIYLDNTLEHLDGVMEDVHRNLQTGRGCEGDRPLTSDRPGLLLTRPTSISSPSTLSPILTQTKLSANVMTTH